MRIAAIDLGSNSSNLLIAEHRNGRLVDVVRDIRVTRLGEGVAHHGVLGAAAMDRVYDTLRTYADAIRDHEVDHVTIGATAACRIATNTPEFFSRVTGIVGASPRLLSAREEAELAWNGAVRDLTDAALRETAAHATAIPASTVSGSTVSGSTLVVDIGGASTELTVGTTGVDQTVSLPFGVVTLTESELRHDPPRAEELSNAVSIVGDAVDNAALEAPGIRSATRVIGVAGTIVTIAAVELGLATFDAARLHGMTLSKGAAEDVFRTLATEKLSDRIYNPGLPRERADVIVAGCCLLVAIMRRLHLADITVSTHNLLDGLVLRALAERQHDDDNTMTATQ
jgi:exopolyphosphatase/guanosine-5'-triphosphate,3'-diphosphate pyrophosphatase